jgi:hypothetical protein
MAERRQDRALVGNSQSERQIRAAKKVAKAIDDRCLFSLRQTLKTPDGRALLFELLREAGVMRSVWDDHGQRMARKVGQQEFGHFMYARCFEADENNAELMLREGRTFDSKTRGAAAPADDQPDEESDDDT